ncbi:MAG: Glutathione-regulated potassium-efflux system protein KefB [uncultured Campylobacterales bacterium]|uniref:Glutathione-regulated potassium-efflux system protein KefB n=1 Tax=uncultured Campylobacterales bacterium TaxID=352960 RepID=A0A6S6T153_9BACT|nr:MAG: Glutathione-regulated potassium-efflux system protein KefB [uncultured Campylobacterales bacterium]
MLNIIVLTLFIALVVNIILKRFHLPTIIGYILTGTIITILFDLNPNNHELKEIAEFGIVFLMFTIGLEFSLKELKRMRYEVFVIGFLQIFLTSIAVFSLSKYLFSIPSVTSFVIAVVVALSSTAIVLKTFNETNETRKRYGQLSIGILIMQDIIVIPILLIIAILGSDTAISMDRIIFQTFISGLLLLGILWIIGNYLLDYFFSLVIKTKSDELFIGIIFFITIGASYLAYALGFSYSLGAFVAGMLIAETKYKYQIQADLTPFRDLLLGVFFITIGMQIDISIAFEYLHIIVLLLLGVFALKSIVIFLLLKFKEITKTSFKTAISLMQMGEFSLVVLELASKDSLIDNIYSQVFTVTIVLSMIITPIILKNLTFIADFIAKKEEPKYICTRLKEHIVIIGYGAFGKSMAAKLKAKGKMHVIIESDINAYHEGVADNEAMIFGNAIKNDVLKNAYIQNAQNIIIAIDNPKKLHMICQNLKTIVPSSKLIIKVHNEKQKELLADLELESKIIVESEEISKTIDSHII